MKTNIYNHLEIWNGEKEDKCLYLVQNEDVQKQLNIAFFSDYNWSQ